jgi:hypothetical protein
MTCGLKEHVPLAQERKTGSVKELGVLGERVIVKVVVVVPM